MFNGKFAEVALFFPRHALASQKKPAGLAAPPVRFFVVTDFSADRDFARLGGFHFRQVHSEQSLLDTGCDAGRID